MVLSAQATQWVLAAALLMLRWSLDRSVLYDDLITSASLVLLITGLTLYLLSKRLARLLDGPAAEYSLPLSDLNSSEDEAEEDIKPRLKASIARPVIVLIGAITFRIVASRGLLLRNECVSYGTEILGPLILGLCYAFKSLSPTLLLSSILITAGSGLFMRMNVVRSSYICTRDKTDFTDVLTLQGMISICDAVILECLSRLASRRAQAGKSSSFGLLLGKILTLSSLVLASLNLTIQHFMPEASHLDRMNWYFLRDVFVMSFFSILAAFTAIPLLRTGPVSLAFLILVCSTFGFELLFARIDVYFVTNQQLMTALFTIGVGSALFYHSQVASTRQTMVTTFSRGPQLVPIIFALLLLFRFLSHFSLPDVPGHPIKALTREAEAHHSSWIAQASKSKTLEEAVFEYERRYRRPPPPRFDVWYNYAVSKGSVIIDDFDTIHDDLEPFWSVPPAEIRHRSWLMSTNDRNEVSTVSIRGGKATISRNFRPTHRWMSEGAVEMINQFSEHLPDMDLVLNINDEPRVLIPWNTAERKAPTRADKYDDSWSNDRGRNWQPVDQNTDSSFLIIKDQQRTWKPWAIAGCPPGSAAYRQKAWNKRDTCMSCASPHSRGLFVADWKSAADICHQPDLENLHGFYLSPAAFQVSPLLVPVFSQSKAAGFNDIIYPSPWNYVDKVKYDPSPEHPDPSFMEKEGSLFWRGATSEGVSVTGVWRGMNRQRFMQYVNDKAEGPVPVLVQGKARDQWQHIGFDPLELQKALTIDVGVVNRIDRCGGEDCIVQNNTLHFAPSTDFQDHWQHKYLYDMDGAGFSGRFLPFLKSHSLPFKTGLFREWFDSRIRAWVHFVPQDFRLHGVYSTLAYFGGLKDASGNVLVSPHEDEAEKIAEQGSKWALSVLRKDDMLVYFFRLLLEYGRITDDRRDELGFSAPK